MVEVHLPVPSCHVDVHVTFALAHLEVLRRKLHKVVEDEVDLERWRDLCWLDVFCVAVDVADGGLVVGEPDACGYAR